MIEQKGKTYYQGVFWIIGDSLKDIQNGNFKLLCAKFKTDNTGKQREYEKKNWVSKDIWNNHYKSKYENLPYNYYPRGRIIIHNGTAYIYMLSSVFSNLIMESVISEYEIRELEIIHQVWDKEEYDHYEFKLE